MEITGNVYQAHRKLSACSAKFLEFIRDNPEALKQSNFHDVLHPNFETEPAQPWPIFINRETKREMEEVGVQILNLIRSIPRRVFSNDIESISLYYGIPGDLVKIQLDGMNDEHLANLLGRGDFIFSPSGMKCIEYNISSTIGGWEVAILAPLYLKTPVISKFLQEYQVKTSNKNMFAILMEHLLIAALKKFSPGSRCNEINIVIALPNYSKSADQIMIEKYVNRQYKHILQLKYSHWQGEAIVCGFLHLNIKDECIFYESKRIHALVEFCQGDVPTPIMEIFKKGNILLYNGPIRGLLGNKLNLVILSQSEDSNLFTLQERKIIKKYIPWTRRLTEGKASFDAKAVDLQDFVLSHREKLVIKSAAGQGGDDVHIGQYTPQPQWEILVKNAARERNWVVQEYTEPYPYLFQSGTNGCIEHHAVWGLLFFGTRYAGGYLRILPKDTGKGVINVHRGAEKAVIFEVDE